MKPFRITALLLLVLLGIDASAITCAPKTPVPGFFGVSVSRARYFNPQTGRFWTVDTFEGSQGDPLSLHKYLYCHADPVNGIDPSGHEFNLQTLLVSAGTIATMASQQLSTIVRQAGPMFQAGARQAWAARQLYGRFAQNTADQVIRLVQTAATRLRIAENIQRGSNFLDYELRIGQRIMDLEVKYKLPDAAGEALSRLVAQAQASVAAGQAQTVVWTFKEPTLQELQLVTTQMGAAATRVQFVHGVDGLLRYISYYFGL